MSLGEIAPKLAGSNTQRISKVAYSLDTVYIPPSSNYASGNLVIGNGAYIGTFSTGVDNTIIGYRAYTISNNNVVIGKTAYSNQRQSVCIGSTSYITGQDSVAIGHGASVQSVNGCVVIGQAAYSTGANSIVLGWQAYSTTSNGIALGTSARSQATNGIAIGSGVITFTNPYSCIIGTAGTGQPDHPGEQMWTSGNFTTGATPTIKYSVVQLLTEVSNTTPVVMGIVSGTANTTTNKITLSNKSVYCFDCDMIASRVDATGTADMTANNYKFVMYKGSTNATTSIGTVTTTNISANGGIGTVAITADTTNGCPIFTFTSGNGSVTMRCVITCNITKLTYSA